MYQLEKTFCIKNARRFSGIYLQFFEFLRVDLISANKIAQGLNFCCSFFKPGFRLIRDCLAVGYHRKRAADFTN